MLEVGDQVALTYAFAYHAKKARSVNGLRRLFGFTKFHAAEGVFRGGGRWLAGRRKVRR